MDNIIEIDNDLCKKCNSCVRVCPVKAIQHQGDDEIPKISHNRCIACGTCFRTCGFKAISYKDSKLDVIALLQSDYKVAAIVDPSICAEFSDITDYRKFVQMIRNLGFDYVHEVSFGVDLVAKKFAELLDEFKGKYYITPNCPSIRYYIEKHSFDQVNNLAPIVTPMSAMSQVVHQLYGNELKVVYIGPCIAAKKEIYRLSNEAKVDAVLTFIELRELFDQFQIKEKNVEFSDFNMPFGYKGSLYPISRGFLEAADVNDAILDGAVTTAEGKKDSINAIKEFLTNIDFIKQHFNLFYCDGCQMGAGSSLGGEKYLRHTLTINYATKRLKDFNKERWEKNLDKYYQSLLLNEVYSSDKQEDVIVDEAKVNEVLRILGRSGQGDDINGCEACGFTSCRDLAISVVQGIASVDMCIGYAYRRKVELEKELNAVQKSTENIQAEFIQTKASLNQEIEKHKNTYNSLYTIIQNITAGVVLVDEKLKIVIANKSVVNILGDEVKEIEEIVPGLVGADLHSLFPTQVLKMFTFSLQQNEPVSSKDVVLGDNLLNICVYPIQKDHLTCAIIRDMFSPEVRNEEVINRVTEVIEENLSTVQQMGFLLGENASKTEKMLNSIIESFKKK